jgi:gamma-glutamylcyclotransferase (GGCT)/AIG2-like uncharacterized protein YtfP/cation transport regulator ChaC
MAVRGDALAQSVLVYGTLLRGMERSAVMKGSAFRGPALIHAALYDLGEYPGIKEGHHRVVGEVYEIDDDSLERLDRIEGYDPRDPGGSLFVRREIEVRDFAEGDRFRAFVYCYVPDAGAALPISHGDYRRYLLEKEDETQWVLAYGSNMSATRIVSRVGRIESQRRGWIPGFSLVFNKRATGGNASYANIKYVGFGRCPAVAWKLSQTQVKKLDHCEGVPDHYLRIAVPFQDETNNTLLCQAYVASPDMLVRHSRPGDEYLSHIRAGYEEHRFDTKYLDEALGG